MKNTFNFYKFLLENGYQKETVRERSGKTFATIYQKEVDKNIWNALTIHQDKTYTASSPSKALEYKNQQQPTSEEEASAILEIIEKL